MLAPRVDRKAESPYAGEVKRGIQEVGRIEAKRDVALAREERLVAELEAARVQCEHLSARVADSRQR